MGISIGNDMMSIYNQTANTKTNSSIDKLSSTISNINSATDEEKLAACKEFEAYFVEKVIKMMHESVKSEEEENDYLRQFGDMQYEAYAKEIANSGQLGIAQQLYEAMKRN